MLVVFILVLGVKCELVQKIFDSHVVAESDRAGVEAEADAGPGQKLGQFKKLILYLISKFFIDSEDPGLKFERNILIVKMKGLGFLCGADKIDEVGVADTFDEVHKLLDHLFLFLVVEGQLLVD